MAPAPIKTMTLYSGPLSMYGAKTAKSIHLKENHMHPVRLRRLTLAVAWVAIFSSPLPTFSQTAPKAPRSGSQAAVALRDGQHDFDFKIGTWATHIRKLQKPLSGSSTWIEYNGTVAVRKVWDGRAALEEIAADGPSGRFEGLTLFLYNASAHQWSLNFA